MNTLLKNWSINQSIKHSKRTILIAFLITIIIGSGIQFILFDDNVMNMLPKDIDSRRIWDEIVEEFKYSDFLFVAFGEKNKDVLTSKNLSLLWDLSKEFETIPEVDEVLSLSNVNRMEMNDGFLDIKNLMPKRKMNLLEVQSLSKYLKSNPNIRSQMLSKNGDYINIIIRPKTSKDFPSLVNAVREVTSPYEKSNEFYFGGQPYIAGKVPELIKTDSKQLIIVGLMIMSLILLVNLRCFSAVGMILLLIIMSMLFMIGLLGWIYYFTGSSKFFFSFIHSSMPLVLLTIANSDGVHIMSRFFRENRNHHNTKKALSTTMNQLSLPIFLTSITTAGAFLTMITSPIPSMTGYGIAIGLGILWAWILSCTLLPALINLKKWNFKTTALSKPSFLEKIVHVLGRNILKRPKIILTCGGIIICIASFGIQFINVEVNLINLFKPGNIIRESTLFLDKEMAGSMNLMIKINEDIKNPQTLNQMVKIQNYLETIPTVNTTLSIADIVAEMHKTIMDNNPNYNTIPDNRKKINNLFTMYSMSGDPSDFESLVNYEYNTGIITAMMHSVSTTDVIQIANKIEKFLDKEISNIDIEVSGLMMFLKDFVALVVQSSITSILVSIGLILCITWIFFRSWKFGILSIIPLTSAVILNFGLMGWFGIDLSHFTALLTSIIIGVGVDFAIHYISEFNHYLNNDTDINKISTKVVNDVGYPILLDVFSNMGFGALIFSSLIPLVQMGSLIIFAMISTSLGTLTILASIMEINKHKLKG
tara:strand:- start:2740 stop:5025 length:2286 start_codon:yes stop_codon:yes gene_type:complete